jgi:hypothetical protein
LGQGHVPSILEELRDFSTIMLELLSITHQARRSHHICP